MKRAARAVERAVKPALWLGQFAFKSDALVLFGRTLDSILELAAIERELLGHLVDPARHIAIDCGPEHHGVIAEAFAHCDFHPMRIEAA
jgi:hypothetical protein